MRATNGGYPITVSGDLEIVVLHGRMMGLSVNGIETVMRRDTGQG